MCERSALRKVFEDASIVPGHGVITVAIIIFDVYGAFDIINRVYDAVVPVTFAIRVTITSIVQPMALHPHPNFECTTLSGIFFCATFVFFFFCATFAVFFFCVTFTAAAPSVPCLLAAAALAFSAATNSFFLVKLFFCCSRRVCASLSKSRNSRRRSPSVAAAFAAALGPSVAAAFADALGPISASESSVLASEPAAAASVAAAAASVAAAAAAAAVATAFFFFSCAQASFFCRVQSLSRRISFPFFCDVDSQPKHLMAAQHACVHVVVAGHHIDDRGYLILEYVQLENAISIAKVL